MTTTAQSAKFRVLGINDDASDCCCCGRQGLRRVVWLQPLDHDGEECGEPVHFGRVCGARAAGWGYGSDTGRIERRIREEEAKARKHYADEAGRVMDRLIAEGLVVKTRVACGFDWKSATHTYGYIYTLPNDSIARITEPSQQQAEIRGAKDRLRSAYPIFRTLDERVDLLTFRSLIAGT